MQVYTQPTANQRDGRPGKVNAWRIHSPTSNSAIRHRAALFRSGRRAGSDYEVTYSLAAMTIPVGCGRGEYRRGTGCVEGGPAWRETRLYDLPRCASLGKPNPFPTTSYGVATNLTPELKNKIKGKRSLAYDFTGTALAKSFRAWSKFVPITSKTQWAVHSPRSQYANGVEYTPQALAANDFPSGAGRMAGLRKGILHVENY